MATPPDTDFQSSIDCSATKPFAEKARDMSLGKAVDEMFPKTTTLVLAQAKLGCGGSNR